MIVTLLTDFGTADYFVGAMKGAILSVNPRVQIVDITHEISAHDIQAGAFTLRSAFESFPQGTTHVAVVDPGVGSSRRAIVVEGDGHLFVGPDNGVFGYVYERLTNFSVRHLTNEKYFRVSVSSTFHGRDVFAPVAGALSCGDVATETLGGIVKDFVRLPATIPQCLPDGTLEAEIIHIDRFGNCVTNITARDLTEDSIKNGARLIINNHEIRSFRRFFAEETNDAGGPFAIWGSAGFLEIAINCDSAARRLNVVRGQQVRLVNM